jgi:hypothetical protein
LIIDLKKKTGKKGGGKFVPRAPVQKNMTIWSDTSFITSPLYKQYTYIVEHKYPKGTIYVDISLIKIIHLFSIKYLYFFIISSLFPYFNLFVSIFIQSYVNIKLHVSTLLNSI